MKAFVITLEGNLYSKEKAKYCINTAGRFGILVEKFPAIDKFHAEEYMKTYDLKWTWANNNTRTAYCPITKLRQHPYKGANLQAKIGCFMSHFLLWKMCVDLGEPILILEHDSVFLRPFPDIKFNAICQINDPKGATRRGKWWSKHMINRGTKGVHEKTWVTSPSERQTPDGLAGNSAYLIKPFAAEDLIEMTYKVGVWPNDALMCKQLFPYLEEYYPFITRVEQEKSTSST